jgi:hypothetical protein
MKIRLTIILIGCLVLLFVVFDILNIQVTRRADALLGFTDTPISYLPQQVSITLDGSTATFCKSGSGYDEFVRLVGHPTITEALGPYPDFGTRARCGQLTIPYFMIRWHFPLYRSTANHNYLWVQLRKLTSPGRTYPVIIDDGHLSRLVQKTERP